MTDNRKTTSDRPGPTSPSTDVKPQAMCDDPPVLVRDDGSVRHITLNRPEVLNACNNDLLAALRQAVGAAEKDEGVRCVVLTGAGRAFCSGQDLADIKHQYESDQPLELGEHLRKLYHPVILKLAAMEKPVIAAVNGSAAGAGASLALACDIRIAGESASFLQAFIHVGLVPDSGSTFFLPRLIGAARAFEVAATGRKVKAEEALQIGLVSRVVPDAELATAAMELAARLASMPTRAMGLTKRALNKAWASDLATQLDYEAMLQTTAGKTADHREGIQAFLEKRPPGFRGR